MSITLIWKFDFASFMVLLIAILNDGTLMTISKDIVTLSPYPDSWQLNEIFVTGVYMALMTVLFSWVMNATSVFEDKFPVLSLRDNSHKMMAALSLQVYGIVTYIPLDIMKLAIRYAFSRQAWNNLLETRLLLPWGGYAYGDIFDSPKDWLERAHSPNVLLPLQKAALSYG